MQDEPKRPAWPNPLRTPLLLVAGLVAVFGYSFWVGGTGGLDSVRVEEDEGALAASITMGTVLSLMGVPALVLLAAGLLAGTVYAGLAGAGAGLCYGLGTSNPRWMPGAAKFLSACARVAAFGGVLLGCAACGLIEIVLRREYAPGPSLYCEDLNGLMWSARDWAFFAPLTGILLGRVLLGALAEGARIRSTEAHSPVFSRFQDLALLVLFVIPWYLYCCYTWTPW